jgi:hypothetical protein
MQREGGFGTTRFDIKMQQSLGAFQVFFFVSNFCFLYIYICIICFLGFLFSTICPFFYLCLFLNYVFLFWFFKKILFIYF